MKRKIITVLFLALFCLGLIGSFIPQANANMKSDSWVDELTDFYDVLAPGVGPQTVTSDSGGRIYVTTNGTSGQLWKSEDEGSTWTLVFENASTFVARVYVDSRDYIYVGYTDLWRSTNYGSTWTKVLDRADTAQLWHIDEDSNGYIYTNVYDTVVGVDDLVYRSIDNGASFNVWFNMTEYGTVKHLHSVDVDPTTDYIYVVAGDVAAGATYGAIYRYNGSGWTEVIRSNATDQIETQPTKTWFLNGYAYFGCDGHPYGLRIPTTGTWTQREKVFFLEGFSDTDSIFWSTEMTEEGIALFTTFSGHVIGTWDGIHYIKIFETTLNGIYDNRLSLEESYDRKFPVYFTDETNDKLYRLNRISKGDLVHLYYSKFNAVRGSVTNAENYVLEQRIMDGTTYLDLTTVALSNVEASIKGLTKRAMLTNAGFEYGNTTGWSIPYGGNNVTVVSDEKYQGTYGVKVTKTSEDPQWSYMQQDKTIYNAENLFILSWAWKSNASISGSIDVSVWNYTGTPTKVWGWTYTTVTSWTKNTVVKVINSTSTWTARIRWVFYSYNVTTWFDSTLFSFPEVGYALRYANADSVQNAQWINDTSIHADLLTTNPTLTINGQQVTHTGQLTNGTESSATDLTGILTGAVEVQANIQGSQQATLKITGTRILYEDSIILQGRTSGVYYGRCYGTFSPTITTNDLIAVTNLASNITAATYSSDRLTLTIDSPSGTTSTTQVYCADEEEPTTVAGVTSWSYNSNTNIVTFTVTHSSEQTVTIDWTTLPYVPPDRYDYTQETWYLRHDTWTVNTVLGYKLDTTQSATATQINQTSASLATFQVGIRVYTVTEAGTETEATVGSPVAIASRSGVGASTETATWTPSGTVTFEYGSAIKVVFYYKIGAGSWTARIASVSRSLETNSIQASTWTVYYRMRIATLGANYDYRIYFGEYTEWTRIQDVSIGILDVYETMDYLLQAGDLVGFVLYPYLNLVGNLFYGLVMLMVCVPLYNRYRSVVPILILFIVFGGAAGIFTLLVPEIGAGLGWIFMLLGLAGLLYKVFR